MLYDGAFSHPRGSILTVLLLQLPTAFCYSSSTRNRNGGNRLSLTEQGCPANAQWVVGYRYFQIRPDVTTATGCNCPTCIWGIAINNDLSVSDTEQCLERLPPPEVLPLPTSPENYNGNAEGGEPPGYLLTMPSVTEPMIAVVRLRYVALNLYSHYTRIS